jgi:hypothetical protein
MLLTTMELSKTFLAPPDVGPDSFGEDAVCLVCGGELDLSQPSVAQPEKLVGACDCCMKIFLIEIDPQVDSYRSPA